MELYFIEYRNVIKYNFKGKEVVCLLKKIVKGVIISIVVVVVRERSFIYFMDLEMGFL